MTNAFISIVFICLLCYANVNAQTQSGFYIILSKDKTCTNPFKALGSKSPMCVSKNPIVSELEFENVSKIIIDSLNFSKHINLKISNEAFNRLQILTTKISNIALVLVVDRTIIGVLENINTLANPIPINSTLNSNNINWIYKRLKKKRIDHNYYINQLNK